MKKSVIIVFKSGNVLDMEIDKDTIIYNLAVTGKTYSFKAVYTNLDFFSELNEVPDIYFYLMAYILFYGLEEITIPDIEKRDLKLNDDPVPFVSYSGGVDSTAVLSLTKGKAVHITRAYDLAYENRQIKAVKYVNAIEITTDVELIREVYLGKKGFNIGIGYISIMLPLAFFYRKNTFALGVVFDDLAFHFGDPFMYNLDFSKSRLMDIITELKKYNIKVYLPASGASEYITTKLAEKSGIQHYSSCHTTGKEDFCKSCFKCFRKYGHKGIKINYGPGVESILKKTPLKMASSTIWAIQKAGYKGELFDKYKTADVSFVERIDTNIMQLFSDRRYINGFEEMNGNDYELIHEFVEFINNL